APEIARIKRNVELRAEYDAWTGGTTGEDCGGAWALQLASAAGCDVTVTSSSSNESCFSPFQFGQQSLPLAGLSSVSSSCFASGRCQVQANASGYTTSFSVWSSAAAADLIEALVAAGRACGATVAK